MERASIPWTAGKAVVMMNKGRCKFDNIIQRSLVWETERKSLLMYSMMENFAIPQFFTRRIGEVYDFLDGKQRMNSIYEFLHGDFVLTGVPTVTYEPDDGSELVEIDVNGMSFTDLPEELRNKIKNYNLSIVYFDEMTDAEATMLFRLLNNGKPLSKNEKNIACCTDIRNVSELGKHELFSTIFTRKGLEMRRQIPIIMKMHCMLTQETPSFESNVFNNMMQDTVLSEEDGKKLNQVFDRYLDLYNTIDSRHLGSESRLYRRRMAAETHLVSFTPFVWKSIEDGIGVELLSDFFCHFYNGVDGASICEEYNMSCKAGSAKAAAIATRNQMLQEEWDSFFSEG